ncbi:unnamed protein product [Dracunculus medinensis]|uniref:Uncharacterized protein n=1 Tax=Dracunculus medinensis TaxID=318479 RepID=A0A0N4U9A9_DRAME|nr:unnamed protein product [Dracunculus medinensis]
MGDLNTISEGVISNSNTHLPPTSPKPDGSTTNRFLIVNNATDALQQSTFTILPNHLACPYDFYLGSGANLNRPSIEQYLPLPYQNLIQPNNFRPVLPAADNTSQNRDLSTLDSRNTIDSSHIIKQPTTPSNAVSTAAISQAPLLSDSPIYCSNNSNAINNFVAGSSISGNGARINPLTVSSLLRFNY